MQKLDGLLAPDILGTHNNMRAWAGNEQSTCRRVRRSWPSLGPSAPVRIGPAAVYHARQKLFLLFVRLVVSKTHTYILGILTVGGERYRVQAR